MRLRVTGMAILCLCVLQSASAEGQKTEASVPATSTTAPELPIASGSYGIGRASYLWIDTARPDRYSSDPNAHRELMVYLWYPAANVAGVRGAYLPGAKQMNGNTEVRDGLQRDYGANWPLIVSGAIYSHAQENAIPVGQKGQFPLLIFSPGMGGTSFGYTSLIENLVSHGYAVAAIEHTYNAPVVFPDGRIFPIRRDAIPHGLPPDEALKRMAAMASAGIIEGSADVRFVLDKLIELKRGERQESLPIAKIDAGNAVAIGHSAGAENAARACQLDARFKACVDLDGGMVPVAVLPDLGDGATLKQPLLMLETNSSEEHMFGTREQHLAYFKKKEEQLESCPRGSFDVELRSAGITHGSFSDDPLLEASDGSARERGLHNLKLIETYVEAFLARTLKGDRNTVLDVRAGDSSEVIVRAYGH